MPNHAQITIIGHAGKDPETRHTPKGDAVCSVSVATTRKRQDKEQTSWWRVQAFGKTAEALGRFVSKGTAFGVVGEPVIETWTDKDGQERQTPTIYADRIILLGKQEDAKPKHEPAKQGGHFDDLESDVPF